MSANVYLFIAISIILAIIAIVGPLSYFSFKKDLQRAKGVSNHQNWPEKPVTNNQEASTAMKQANKQHLSHIMMFEVPVELGTYHWEHVVLFNANRISQEEAFRLAAAEEYNENVLVLPKKQFIALFRDGNE